MTRSKDYPTRPSTRRGMTLIEVTFATVIMSSMLVASLNAVGAAAKGRIAHRDSAVGLSLGRQLMAEILQTRYRDLVDPVFGPEAGETSRALYDDVDDYNSYAETDAKYADGTVIAGATGWKRQVAVSWVTPADPTVTSATDQGLKRIVVTVTAPSGKVFSVTGMRSSVDRYEYVQGTQTTYTCWAGVSIRVGTSAGGRSVQGTNLVNLTP